MKRNRWILLALIAVVAVILLAALLGGHDADKKDSPSVDSEELEDESESSPNIDPATGMELEEDELPIMVP